jgi:hypothetical protein
MAVYCLPENHIMNREASDKLSTNLDSTSNTQLETKQKISTEASRYLASPVGAAINLEISRPGKTSADISPILLTDNSQSGMLLDSSKSLAELTRFGKVVDKTPEHNDAVSSAEKFDPPRIAVEFKTTAEHEMGKHPDFLIKQDGTIEMHANPELIKNGNVTIAVEKGDGQLNPSPSQEDAVNKLTAYLADRIRSESQAKTINLDDRTGLVSPEAAKKANLEPTSPESILPEPTARQVRNMNRLSGNSGEMPASAASDYFPPRQVPRESGESSQTAHIKDAAAGLFNADKSSPYETIRKHSDGQIRVGRYGFSGSQLDYFLASLGEPPDPALIEKLVKEGKLSKDFASKLKNPDFVGKLKNLAASMKNGESPSKEKINEVLPKDAQESIASKLTEGFTEKLGSDPGKVAAGMALGKSPSDVTEQDFSTPQAKELATAGKKLYDLAEAKDKANPQRDTITWDKDGKIGIGADRWLDKDAGIAFKRAQEQAKADGIDLQVNSAGRTYQEQARLYARLNGVSPVARPGTSNHESGNALDIQNWRQAKPYLIANGFTHGDGRGPIANDLVHFKYQG